MRAELNGNGKPDNLLSADGHGLRAFLQHEGAGDTLTYGDATTMLGISEVTGALRARGFVALGDWNGDGATDLFYAAGDANDDGAEDLLLGTRDGRGDPDRERDIGPPRSRQASDCGRANSGTYRDTFSACHWINGCGRCREGGQRSPLNLLEGV